MLPFVYHGKASDINRIITAFVANASCYAGGMQTNEDM